MRIPKYLSPTSISKFYSDRTEYYLSYLADHRPPKKGQTKPMSVGSAFDAYIKSHLVERLFGKGSRPEFEFEAIFESQVEEQNRDFAREAGEHVFKCYQISGALSDLMLELQSASSEPQFEFTVQDRIPYEGNAEGVPLLGKPDCYFKTKADSILIIDWKVNGYCSNSAVSPKPGYIQVRDGWKNEPKHTRSHNSSHRDCHIMMVDGIMINIAEPFEEVDSTWARQLVIYAWLVGAPICGRFLIGIDQIVGRPGTGKLPDLRVASHRGRVSKEFQAGLLRQIKDMWDIISSGWIFDEFTREESDARCESLDDYHLAFNDLTPNEEWYTSIMRKHAH